MFDNLTLAYNGNQLRKVSDAADVSAYSITEQFLDFANTDTEYAYNANGAMTSDPDKGAQYAYNAFGMPSQVKVPAILGTIDYKYSATGERLEASYKWHSGLSLDPQENVNRPTYTATNSSKLRQYVGNKVYENGSLKRILFDNGCIEGGIYYFYLRDHLGNNSVVAKADGQVVQRNHYYPYGKVIGNGESWGQAAQPYKFGGKEEETMFGLELYDFHARQMDRRIPGFLTVDPLAEKYYSISPYGYCMNNPLRFIDPTGMDWYESKEGKVMWINEENKEMKETVKGWKNLGDTYKGFTVKTYQAYDATDGSSRSSIEISYKSPNGDKTEGWVQTVKTNAPKKGEAPHSIDPPKGSHDNFPYYDSKAVTERNRFLSELDGYDMYFSDGATRLKERGDFYFNAELSLIKKQTLGQTLGNTTFLGMN